MLRRSVNCPEHDTENGRGSQCPLSLSIGRTVTPFAPRLLSLTRCIIKSMRRVNCIMVRFKNAGKDIRADGSLDIPSFGVARDVLRRVDKAFAAFFRRVKAGQKAGYPRFRSRHRYDSITFPAYGAGCRVL